PALRAPAEPWRFANVQSTSGPRTRLPGPALRGTWGAWGAFRGPISKLAGFEGGCADERRLLIQAVGHDGDHGVQGEQVGVTGVEHEGALDQAYPFADVLQARDGPPGPERAQTGDQLHERVEGQQGLVAAKDAVHRRQRLAEDDVAPVLAQQRVHPRGGGVEADRQRGL